MQKTQDKPATASKKAVALEARNWEDVSGKVNEKGFAIIPGLLADHECDEIKENYDRQELYRKTITMERYRFGMGEYKYFDYPLPERIQQVREDIYPFLVPTANGWFKALNIDRQFPVDHAGLLKQCRQNQQQKPTPLILKYRKGGHNTLHQDLYGEIFFPLQIVIFLNEYNDDYTGGEFVLTEQIPRAQSKAIVLKPAKGDALVFTTNFRPVKGTRGYFRVNMKHGVSEVHSGERYTLGIIFHDAQT